MNACVESGMRAHASLFSIALAAFALAGCSPKGASQADASVSAIAASPATASVAPEEARKCTNEPHAEDDKRPRCGGMANAPPAPQAYRVVGGGGDPVDQVVCDITDAFVLDGKLFGVEFSGGTDGTYKFVRTPNLPGLHWQGGGRYHVEFPEGPTLPGTMATEGGGTTTAGSQSRTTSGGERFTLTPVPACEASP